MSLSCIPFPCSWRPSSTLEQVDNRKTATVELRVQNIIGDMVEGSASPKASRFRDLREFSSSVLVKSVHSDKQTEGCNIAWPGQVIPGIRMASSPNPLYEWVTHSPLYYFFENFLTGLRYLRKSRGRLTNRFSLSRIGLSTRRMECFKLNMTKITR